MKKLSSITESVWGDIYKRGAGEQTRKEDIIASREQLDEIIKSAYKEQGKGDTLTLDFTGKKILVDDLSYLFKPYRDVKHIYGLETWDVSQVTNMICMFDSCEADELNIENWDVSKVTNMCGMFAKCYNLTKLDIGNWDVSQVKDMSYMFNGCKTLTNLNIGDWNTRKVENMTGMFEGCQNLTELNIGDWDVSQVEKMKWMFNNCQNLTELNIGDWDVSKVKDVYQMFAQCPVEYIKRRNKLVRI